MVFTRGTTVRMLLALLVLAALLGAGRSFSAPDNASPVAMITYLSGKVSLQGAGSTAWKAAHLGASLYPGQTISLDKNSSCIITYFKNGPRLQVKGPTQASVQAQGLKVVSGPKDAIAPVPASRIYVRQGQNVGIEHLGVQGIRAIRFVEIQSPVHTVLSTRPAFRWHYLAAHPNYTVFLFDSQGKAIWQRPATKEVLPYPKDEKPLVPGETYAWFPAAGEALGSMDQPEEFKVLDASSAADLDTLSRRLRANLKKNPQDPSPLKLLVMRYVELDLLEEAYKTGLDLQAKFPKENLKPLLDDLKSSLNLAAPN